MNARVSDEVKSKKHLMMASELMKDEFSKHRCPGQERRRMLEAAEKTVSRSFLCLVFVVSQSVIVGRTACLFCGGRVRCMCGGGLCD